MRGLMGFDPHNRP